MSTGAIIAIIVVVVVVVALVVVGSLGMRRRRLQQRFGPEYDRAVEGSDSRFKAESELAEREKRVKGLDIRPLDPAARDRYAAEWTSIQEQFVDSPADAVTGAQTLITGVMRDRGYPTDDADQIMADLSVEHASTLEHFRTAQELSSRAAGGTASTEDLRQSMVHYRTLFRELVGDESGTAVTTDGAVTDGAVTDRAATDAAVADGAVTDTAATETGVTDDAEYEPSVTVPDPGPRDADEMRAEAARPSTASAAETIPDPVPADGSGATAVYATPTDATPADAELADRPTDAELADRESASARESEAEQADAAHSATASRLPWKR